MLLSTVFFIMFGLGFMYQQAVGLVRPKLSYVKRRIKAVQQVEDEAPTEELAAEDTSEATEIAKAISACRSSLSKRDVASFTSIVRKESRKYGHDWKLILAIIRAESQFNIRARSNKGARGLMQVLPSTAKWLSPRLGLEYKGRDSLYDPEYNVKLGTYYLHMMHRKFGDIEKAIAAYNRGPTGLLRYLSQGKKLPCKYLEKVMAYYEELKSSSDEYAS